MEYVNDSHNQSCVWLTVILRWYELSVVLSTETRAGGVLELADVLESLISIDLSPKPKRSSSVSMSLLNTAISISRAILISWKKNKKIRIGYVLKSADVRTQVSSRYSENSSHTHPCTSEHTHTHPRTFAYTCTHPHTHTCSFP